MNECNEWALDPLSKCQQSKTKTWNKEFNVNSPQLIFWFGLYWLKPQHATMWSDLIFNHLVHIGQVRMSATVFCFLPKCFLSDNPNSREDIERCASRALVNGWFINNNRQETNLHSPQKKVYHQWGSYVLFQLNIFLRFSKIYSVMKYKEINIIMLTYIYIYSNIYIYNVCV